MSETSKAGWNEVDAAIDAARAWIKAAESAKAAGQMPPLLTVSDVVARVLEWVGRTKCVDIVGCPIPASEALLMALSTLEEVK